MKNSETNEPAVFDLEALMDRCLHNRNLVDRVLTKFTNQVDADLAELEQTMTAGSAPDVARLAHRIKGMTASIEARAMCASASCCERAAMAAATEEFPARLACLRTERKRLFVAIENTQQEQLALSD
ncbi:MAG: Hpt domain-containing protein [Pirellulales bacterium]|nr:Hpt domain-containing protein [Pirellulales bacterium]